MTEAEIDIRMREEFSKICFETLLQFSFSNKVTTPQEGYISRMALSVLLKRSQDVLYRYIEDERLSGKCPLPRYAEFIFCKSSQLTGFVERLLCSIFLGVIIACLALTLRT